MILENTLAPSPGQRKASLLEAAHIRNTSYSNKETRHSTILHRTRVIVPRILKGKQVEPVKWVGSCSFFTS